jgi:hypothetical protein
LADRDVVGSNGQKRKGHRNVQCRIRLLLGATFNRGKGTPKCPLADRDVVGSNIQKRELPLGATFEGRTAMSVGG